MFWHTNHSKQTIKFVDGTLKIYLIEVFDKFNIMNCNFLNIVIQSNVKLLNMVVHQIQRLSL